MAQLPGWIGYAGMNCWDGWNCRFGLNVRWGELSGMVSFPGMNQGGGVPVDCSAPTSSTSVGMVFFVRFATLLVSLWPE
ncbi:hypothetical protein Nepgr_021116 [Nepenthes gracilis]|uniref:Uncharacterized protein n=1 Tax=Nepenthes gracilis TaxID=150966 RepID=A0AAD3XWX9_NEPGR|nr:hypothetical protein Nepgr_021116 [Nepenthes gracilis]